MAFCRLAQGDAGPRPRRPACTSLSGHLPSSYRCLTGGPSLCLVLALSEIEMKSREGESLCIRICVSALRSPYAHLPRRGMPEPDQ